MSITKTDQNKITTDLATAVTTLLAAQEPGGNLAGLDPRALAMAFAVHAGALVKSGGGDYNNFMDMIVAAWGGETMKTVLDKRAPKST